MSSADHTKLLKWIESGGQVTRVDGVANRQAKNKEKN